MRDENARIREKFELSLDGRQIASIVVGALVIVGVVFVLGLNVGRQISARRAEAAHAGDLEALDRAPAAPVAPGDGPPLTFHDRLTKQHPAPPPPAVEAPKPAPAEAPAAKPAVAEATPPAAADVAASPVAAAAPVTAALAAPTPAVAARTVAAPAEPRRPAGATFAVQLGAAQSRPEAERLAVRFRSWHPRVEAAAVTGKGRWYRVRAGSFESREGAERLRRDIARGTGASGFVVAER